MEPTALDSIVRWTSGHLHGGDPALFIETICTDSRALKAADLFLALRGENFDGHTFVAEAARRGAIGAVVEESLEGLPPGFAQVQVGNTLAALQQISPDLKEAAAIEGASRWTFFWRITFPLLMPTTLFVLVNAIINAFRLVDHIFVMTGGGPDNATSVLLFQIYVVGFKFFDQAYAATLTIVLLTILGLIAVGQFILADKRVHYQ